MRTHRLVQNPAWRPILEPARRKSAIAVAREVSSRLRDPACVEAAAVRAREQTSFPRAVQWSPFQIAQGYAGLAVMSGYLDSCFTEEGWDVVAHQYLKTAVQPEDNLPDLPAGLFGGFSGLTFAAWYLSREGIRYQRFLVALEERLIPTAMSLAKYLSVQNGVPVHRFDLISGLSGVGAFLLCRREEEKITSVLRAVLGCLIALSEEESGVPRWHTPPSLLDKEVEQTYPNGYLNCGLAHGIPGPLALLSLACISGVQVEGMTDAIQRIADWLIRNRADDEWGVSWPTAVPLWALPAEGNQGFLTGDLAARPAYPAAPRPSRTAWCYGSPGVARSLWLAGQALDEQEYRDVALAAMKVVYDRPLAARNIDSPTFCHGVAGLLQITLRFAHDTDLPVFGHAASMLCDQLLSLYEPDTLLGYRSLEPTASCIDHPGLLDGAAGIPLVLLASATPVEPTWDRLFLLA